MLIVKTKSSLENHLKKLRNQEKIIGFVPTMGALHNGHLSLFEKAKDECDVLVASIFVNPTQFNNPSDLDNYPKTFEADCEMLEAVGCNFLFAPEVSEMYNLEELNLKQQNIEDKSWAEGKLITFGIIEKVMEGAKRPGHFNGVAQVVSKLFRIVKPQKAFFGQKDFQQLMIIRSMVKQLGMPIEIISCPIVRESNGLAMSSRNKRLDPNELEAASLISKTLFEVKKMQNEKSIDELKAFARQQIKAEPKFEIEYFEISDFETLEPAKSVTASQHLVACIALKLGSVRLIDNIELEVNLSEN